MFRPDSSPVSYREGGIPLLRIGTSAGELFSWIPKTRRILEFMKTRRGVGIVVLGCLAASSLAEAPGKVLGTWIPQGPDGRKFTDGGLTFISNRGNAGFNLFENHRPIHGIQIVNGVLQPAIRSQQTMTIDDHGNYVTAGGMVSGVYSYYTNSLLHKPDGSVTPVAGDPSIYKYVYVRGMNNAGVMVGHYSAIDQFGDLFRGYAFYRANGVTHVFDAPPTSTFFAVNDHGNALAMLPGGIGVWAPGKPFRIINGFFDGGFLSRLDFNNKDEIAYVGVSATLQETVYVHTPDARRELPFPNAGGNFAIGGFNNFSHLTAYQWTGGRYRWMVHRDGQWIDFTDRVLSQLPAGWKLDNLGDIDDYGRTYGIAKTPEGYAAIVHINTVPEPATLGALALGLMALRRKRKVA